MKTYLRTIFVSFLLVFLFAIDPKLGVNANNEICNQPTCELNWGLFVPPPWIQTQGGGVHVGGVFNPYPLAIPTPTPSSLGYFSLDFPAGNPGVVSCKTQCTNFGGGLVSTKGWKMEGITFDSNYDFALYKARLNPTCTVSTGVLTLNPSQVNTTGVRCFTPSGGAIINANVTIPASASSIVMVDGDLTFNAPVTITSGGFIAFIVSGNITFGNSIGSSPPDNTTDTSGIYIATNKILVETSNNPLTEKQFVGKGTFIGYGGVQIKRNLGAGNANYPAALFIYDTDLNRSTDAKLLRSQILWQEVSP